MQSLGEILERMMEITHDTLNLTFTTFISDLRSARQTARMLDHNDSIRHVGLRELLELCGKFAL